MHQIIQRVAHVFRSRLAPWVSLGLGGVTAWGIWEALRIAGGLREGIAFSYLPQTLPLIFTGVVYIDRFAAVLAVLLGVGTLLVLARGTWSALGEALLGVILVGGILASSTPFTLIAWCALLGVWIAWRLPRTQARLVYAGIVLMSMSIFLLSAGAFLADMTTVATVSGQLSRPIATFALALLFVGAFLLGNKMHYRVAQVGIVYIVLRMCLFFLGSVNPALLTVLALVGAVLMLMAAHTQKNAPYFALLAAMPLAMLAVALQEVQAVQGFLFGGLAIFLAGLGRGILLPRMVRIVQSAFPGALYGTGLLLVLYAIIVLGMAAGGVAEKIYLLVLGLSYVVAGIMDARFAVRANDVALRRMSIQAVLAGLYVLAGAVFLPHMLAYLGTDLGGSSPDFALALPFTFGTMHVVPWVLLLVGCILVLIVRVVHLRAPRVWSVLARAGIFIEHTIDRGVAYGVKRVSRGKGMYQGAVAYKERKEQVFFARIQAMSTKEMVLAGIGVYIFVFIVLG